MALPSFAGPRRPTDEQAQALASSSHLIVVNAYAGCGKSTFLDDYARQHPYNNFLYLAYNKALEVEARSHFPSNTTTKTTHGLAYPSHGAHYKHKLGTLRPLDLTERFQLNYGDARTVLDTLTNFITGMDARLNENHLPLDNAEVNSKADHLLGICREVWLAMVDKSDPLAMSHDGYLKLYAMSAPDLSRRFSTILFDEAQDANPVTTQIVLAQRNMQVIMVGDRYQGIYGFRGANNAMEHPAFAHADHHYLTKSFRFGHGVAQLASQLLRDFLDEKRPLQGIGSPATTRFTIDPSRPHAILARTNATIFEGASAAADTKTPFCLRGGYKAYNFDQVEDAWRLRKGERDAIRDPFLRRFRSFSMAKDYANQASDIALGGLVRLADEYGAQIPRLVELVRQRNLDDTPEHRRNALVEFSTAHRSKGLEFDQVKLANDFMPLIDTETHEIVVPDTQEKREEIQLLYVATTRAKSALEIHDGLAHYLHQVRSPLCAQLPPPATPTTTAPKSPAAEPVIAPVMPPAPEPISHPDEEPADVPRRSRFFRS